MSRLTRILALTSITDDSELARDDSRSLLRAHANRGILIDEETGQTDTHDNERTREPVAV